MTVIPQSLRHLEKVKCWVNYTGSKVPVNPNRLCNAKSTVSKTWGNYVTAVQNVGKSASVKVGKDTYLQETVQGVGLVLGSVSGLCGIDLDDVIDSEGNIDPVASEIIEMMDSYTELSPSGTGIHILFTGKCPVTGVKVNPGGKFREMYSEGRYFTVTGNVYQNRDKVQKRTVQADKVFRQYYQPYQKAKKKTAAKKQKDKSHTESYGNTAIDAIKRHDSDYFRKKLKEPRRKFDNRESFFDFIYHYPLTKLLDVEENSSFCCFFHEDHNPSASVYRSGAEKGKKWLYHCYAEDMTLNIKTLIEKAGDFDSEVDAIEFIKASLNITLTDTKWTRKQQQTIDLILDKMVRTDEESFSVLCPTAGNNIRYGKSLYIQILILAKGTIYPSKQNETGDVLFYMSVNQLLQATERGSKDKVVKWIKCLCYHHLLEAVPDHDIPKDLLAKAKRQSVNGNRHISFFRIPSMVYKRLSDIEHQGKKWKENRYTLKGTSYEMFYRAEGSEVANKLYPQRLGTSVGNITTVGTAANIKAEARHEKVHEIAIQLLQEQGYFTERQIVERYGSKQSGTLQVKRSLTEISNMYGLTRRKAGKALKQRFSIVSEGYPYIYYQG